MVPDAAPADDGRRFVRATSKQSPAGQSPSATPSAAGPTRQRLFAPPPKSSVAWSVEPDPPAEPSEPPGKSFDMPIPIGTPAFVRDRTYAAPASGRAVVLHAREGTTFISNDGPGFPRMGRIGHSVPQIQKRQDCWLTWHDLGKGRLIERLSLEFNARLLALNPQGDVALLRPEPDDGRLIGWSLRDNKSTFEFRPFGGASSTAGSHNPLADSQLWAAFTDDEHVLVYNGQSNELSCWRVPKGDAVYRKTVNRGADANLSPGRRYVAIRDARSVQFFDVATGGLKGELLFREGYLGSPRRTSRPHAPRVPSVSPARRVTSPWTPSLPTANASPCRSTPRTAACFAAGTWPPARRRPRCRSATVRASSRWCDARRAS